MASYLWAVVCAAVDEAGRMIVTFDWSEALFAANVGVMRRISALKEGRREPYGWDPDRDPWVSDIQSSAAEMAAAKALDRYWKPYSRDPHLLPGDVGRLQVRSTQHRNGGLILHHSRDADDATFVLVRGEIPRFEVVGTIRGGDGKRDEWWQKDWSRPAFLVPAEFLVAL